MAGKYCRDCDGATSPCGCSILARTDGPVACEANHPGRCRVDIDLPSARAGAGAVIEEAHRPELLSPCGTPVERAAMREAVPFCVSHRIARRLLRIPHRRLRA